MPPCRQHGDAVFAADGLLHALGDHLQQQRDKEVRTQLFLCCNQ